MHENEAIGIRLDPMTRAIETYIEVSVEQLLQGADRPHQNGLLFLSAWHEAMPALIHLDPVLEPVDSRVFAVLWLWGKQAGRGSTAFPSYEYLLQHCNIHSRSTLARSLAILRICRWVTLCRRVRDASGQHRGNIYALHEEPLALASTVYLDPGYMDFLHAKAQDRHKKVQRVAKAMLESLEECMHSGEDVLAASPLSPVNQRLEALAAIAGQGQGAYFGLRPRALSALQAWRGKNAQTPSLDADPGSHLIPDSNTRPVQNANLVDKSLILGSVQNLDSADGVQNLDSVGKLLISGRVQNLDSALCSSSYINKKTTTTYSGRDLTADSPPSAQEPALIYPETFSRNEQRLTRMYLRGLDPELQQALLDELADKIKRQAKTDHAVRNPIGLLAWMCARTRGGLPPLTSAHLQYRERRAREQHLNAHLEAEQRRLTEMALGRGNTDG